MEAIMEEIKKVKKRQKIEGLEYLQHGDMKTLAKELCVHEQTVSKVVRGEYENERVAMAVIALVEIRKTQLDEIVNKVAGINEN